MPDEPTRPQGELLLRTQAMPADTNSNGDIFGGWIMAQMDMAGGILAKQVAGGRVATVAADAFKFIRPVNVGDVVACHGRLVHVGTTSLRVALEIWVTRGGGAGAEPFPVTEAEFTYVAIDEAGAKRVHGRTLADG